MFQFYLLSILFNTLTGLVLISNGLSKKTHMVPASADDYFNDEVIDPLNEDEPMPKSKKSKKVINNETLEKVENKLSANEVFSNQTFRLVVGILTILVGFIKLFVVVRSGVKVFADFFPAVVGMFAGFAVLVDYYTNRYEDKPLPEFVKDVFVVPSTIWGIIVLVVALLHFVFPNALFL